jgi:hypothetical protein
VKSGDSRREETKHDGEGWPESASTAPATASSGLGLLGSARGARKGNERGKLDLASDSAAGRLSGDGLAGATRGNPDVEAGGALANRGGK